MFTYISPSTQTKVDGTFEGGGSLGTAYIGALMALQQRGIWFERVSGNSAGAITASLIAAGYDANEIDWLTAPPLPQSSPLFRQRPSTVNNKLRPINFKEFIDRPATTEIPHRHESILWHLVHLTVVDELLQLQVQTPPIDQYILNAVNGVLGVLTAVPVIQPLVQQLQADIDSVIRTAFTSYPRQVPLGALPVMLGGPLASYLALADQQTRKMLADAAVDAWLNSSQDNRTIMHLLCEGSLVKGDAILEVIGRILKAKVLGDPDAHQEVTFRDLPKDLIILATDITKRQPVFFSKQFTPGESVAKAVRQSMSVPFFFRHLVVNNDEVVDGGLMENFPWWVFLPLDTPYTRAPLGAAVGVQPVLRPGTTIHFPPSISLPAQSVAAMAQADVQRPKLAFSLDDDTPCPANYNCKPGPWAGKEDIMFTESLKKSGIFDNTASLPSLPAPLDLPESQTAKRALAVCKSASSQLLEQVALDLASKHFSQFHHAGIPLKDFFWLDFTVNEDIDKFNGMAMRGWETAMDLVNKAGLAPAATLTNPYR